MASRTFCLLGLIAILGCTGGQRDPLSPAGSDPAAFAGSGLIGAMTASQPGMVEGVTAGWSITISTEPLQATVTPWRSAAVIQGKLYDLDVHHFFQPTPFRVTGLRFDADGNVLMDYVITHPFPAPDFTKPVSALNRADLGFTGRLLFLVDVPAPQVAQRTYFSSTVVANTDVILNANHYVRPGDLLVPDLTGFNANAFPARLVVDEALNSGNGNRIGVSNGGNPRGNYNAAQGGWIRLNIGAERNGWTGFDFLHQGQSAANTVAVSKDAIASGSATLDAALLIKYTDPRGVPFPQNPQVRMPQDPADPAVFAYRMPNGAFDGSDISFQGLPGRSLALGSIEDSEEALTILVRDWDARAPETTESILANDADLGKVNIGTSGPPVVAVSAPSLSATTFPFTAGGQSGRPGDEIAYSGTIINRLGTAPIGSRQVALVRASDPEQSAPGKSTYHFGVDPDTLVGDPLRAVRVISYQAVYVEIEELQPTFTWVNTWGETGREYVYKVAVDALGNSYAAGEFSGTVDFDPGPGTVERTSQGSVDAFVVSFTPAGIFRWVATWGGGNPDTALNLALDSSGNVYIAGGFLDTVDFDPGPGTEIRSSAGNMDAYVVALTSAGALRWVTAWGGSLNDSATALTPDSLGQVRVTGQYSGTVDFDPGPGTANRTSQGEQDAYLLTLDQNGQYQWVATWGGLGPEAGLGVALDSAQNILVGGLFTATVDFDPGPGTANRTSLGNYDCFLLKLSSTGEYQWASTWGGADFDYLNGVAVDNQDRPYTTGWYSGLADFDPGPGTEARSSQGGTEDAYVLALDAGGAYRWVQVFGSSTQSEAGFELTLNAAGHLLLTGQFGGEVDFDPGPGTMIRTSAGEVDPYLMSLTTAGSFRWVAAFGGTGINAAYGVATDQSGHIFLSGTFRETADFDPGPGTASRTSNGMSDCFLVKFAPP